MDMKLEVVVLPVADDSWMVQEIITRLPGR